MFTLDVQRTHIRALCLFAARGDVRFYLNAVCFEAGPGGARMIATDGYRLAVIDPPNPVQIQGLEVKAGIVPIEALTGIKKAKKGQPETVTICIDPTPSELAPAGIWVIEDAGTKSSGKLVDGRFPDWRRVCNIKPTGIVQQFNAEYLGDYAKAARELGSKWAGICISHSGEKKNEAGEIIAGGSGAIVTIPGYPEFFSVVMPMRTDEPQKDTPAWVLDSLQPKAEEPKPAPVPETEAEALAA